MDEFSRARVRVDAKRHVAGLDPESRRSVIFDLLGEHEPEAFRLLEQAVTGARCEWHGPHTGEVTPCCIHNAARKAAP